MFFSWLDYLLLFLFYFSFNLWRKVFFKTVSPFHLNKQQALRRLPGKNEAPDSLSLPG
jgi:hypothetical protein